MSRESIDGRIDRLYESAGPFTDNTIEGAMGWVWKADLNPTTTPSGRMMTQEQLARLPFWEKMK